MDPQIDHSGEVHDDEREPRPPRPSLAAQARAAVSERTRGLPAWVVLIELFIGLGWLRAAAEKAIDPGWWRGEVLATFLGEHQGLSVVWYRPFLDLAVTPHLLVTALVVLVAQLGAGLSLVTGRHRAVGLGVGLFLNLNFLAAGAVNPSAFYLLSQGAVALWLAERTARHGTVRRLFAVRATAVVTAVASVPFIRTVQPAEVIDDPAAMFVLGGMLTVVAVDVVLRNRADQADGAGVGVR